MDLNGLAEIVALNKSAEDIEVKNGKVTFFEGEGFEVTLELAGDKIRETVDNGSRKFKKTYTVEQYKIFCETGEVV